MYDLHELIDAVVIIQSVIHKLGDSPREMYQRQALNEALKLINYEIDREKSDFNEWLKAESMGSR